MGDVMMMMELAMGRNDGGSVVMARGNGGGGVCAHVYVCTTTTA